MKWRAGNNIKDQWNYQLDFWEDKIDRPLKARLRKNSLKYIKSEMKEETLQLTTEIQRIIRNYCEQFYANKLLNLEEMDKFLEMYNLPRLNHEEIENLNRPIIGRETETNQKSPNKEKPKTRWFHWCVLPNI